MAYGASAYQDSQPRQVGQAKRCLRARIRSDCPLSSIPGNFGDRAFRPPAWHNGKRSIPQVRRARFRALQPTRAKLISYLDQFDTLPELLGERGYLSHQSGKWWEGSYKHGGFTHGMTRGFPERGGRHGDDGLKIGREGMKPIEKFVDHAVAEKKPFFLWYGVFLPILRIIPRNAFSKGTRNRAFP